MLCNRGSAPSLGLNYIALHEMCPPVNNLRPPPLRLSFLSRRRARSSVAVRGTHTPRSNSGDVSRRHQKYRHLICARSLSIVNAELRSRVLQSPPPKKPAATQGQRCLPRAMNTSSADGADQPFLFGQIFGNIKVDLLPVGECQVLVVFAHFS